MEQSATVEVRYLLINDEVTAKEIDDFGREAELEFFAEHSPTASYRGWLHPIGGHPHEEESFRVLKGYVLYKFASGDIHRVPYKRFKQKFGINVL